MGSLSKLQTVRGPGRVQAAGLPGAGSPFWYTDTPWIEGLRRSGVDVPPEMALTLSHVYSAVDIISGDFGTMSCQLFRDLGEKQGKAKVRSSEAGIGRLAYQLRWAPNVWQTAKAFWSTLAWQYLLRPMCLAEIIYRPGSDSFIDQLVPRHPDRVRQEVLPSSRLRFRLTEANGQFRYVTQDEMFVVRNTSTDGLNAISRIQYGAKTLATGIALQEFTRNYFQKGATAALIATYKGGDMEPHEEEAYHARISRFMNGSENAGGIFLTPEDLEVKALGVEPEKAQLLGLKNMSGRDVARMFKIPPSWLAIEGATGYGSAVQDTQDYSRRCQVPIVVEFEQAIQRDLIVASNDLFFAKYNMNYITRATLKERMESYEIGIRARVLRPSEARELEDMNADEELDELSALDHRAGSQRDGADNKPKGQAVAANDVRRTLLTHDAAGRALRRERGEIEKLAKKFANDVDGWKAGLRAFEAAHAQYIAEAFRMNPDVARAYAALHGQTFEAEGAAVILGPDADQWERHEAGELTALALAEGEQVDRWFSERSKTGLKIPQPIHVTVPLTIADGAVKVDARTTVAPTTIDVRPANVTIAKDAVRVTVPAARRVRTTVTRDAKGRITGSVEDEV